MKIKTTLEKVNVAVDEIRANGGSVRINGTAGSFSIRGVEGRFNFSEGDGVLTVAIDDKPWLASEEMIEEKVRDFFV